MSASKKFSREFFQRKGRKGGKSASSANKAAAARLLAEVRLRQWCREAGHDYDTLPLDDETGRKLLPDAVRNKYLHWRYGGTLSDTDGWKPKRRKKK